MNVAEIDDRISKCNKILGENPNSQIFAALADAYRKKGQLDQAFRVCQNGLRIHPNYVSAHMVMARINLDKGMYDWAEIEVNKAIVLEGNSFATDLLLAEIYIRKGEFPKATKLLDKLQKMDPANQQIQKLMELCDRIPQEASVQLGSGGPGKSDAAQAAPKPVEPEKPVSVSAPKSEPAPRTEKKSEGGLGIDQVIEKLAQIIAKAWSRNRAGKTRFHQMNSERWCAKLRRPCNLSWECPDLGNTRAS
jgi:tetratricopeptide (TPR) repeat protein